MGEVLHREPSLGVIALLYQRGTDCEVTSIYPDLVRLVFVDTCRIGALVRASFSF